MDERLKLYQAQRAVLLASDEADLDLLKRHDRTLLAAMDGGVMDSPLVQADGADEALLQGLADADTLESTLLLLEARARIWPGELARFQALLLSPPTTCSAPWWLAAHYPALPCPAGFPAGWQEQVWAARAFWRRGAGGQLPAPWRDWASALDGSAAALPTAGALWQTLEREGWRQWLPPLLAIAEDDEAIAMINWLSARVEDASLVEMMGLSCQSRFLPWLASVQHDSGLGSYAQREIQWLTGGQESRQAGRQCWGEPLAEASWSRLFRRLPLGFRGRLWHWCGRSLQGSASSLQGGLWCAGN